MTETLAPLIVLGLVVYVWMIQPLPSARAAPQSHVSTKHPLDKYVVRAAGFLAFVTWVSGLGRGRFTDTGDYWFGVVLGLPIIYGVYFILVRFIVRCGIHVYNFGLRAYEVRTGTRGWGRRAS